MDIGGANTKAAWLQDGSLRTVSRPFEIWRDRDALSTVLRELAAEAGPADAVAITMTAELSDAFRTKREGVAFVLDAAEAALGELSVLTVTGELVPVAAARTRPWDVAAANWVATALAVADAHRDALLIDVGSTTTDVIPIAGGRIAATGRNDLERLLAGELVYTGALRTNLAAIAPRVPVRGEWCPVSSESFAISADVHLVLGHLQPEAYDCPTPDGRPATVAFARERIARLVCSDLEQLDASEVDAIATFLHAEQLRQIEDAARRVRRRGTGRRGRLRGLPRPRGRGAPGTSGGRLPHLGPGGGAGRAAGEAPVLTVVKVGGGVGADALPALCTTLGELGERHPLLVVPGGAGFADAVRDADRRFGLRAATSDRMAILGMEQFGWLLSDLIPGAERSTRLEAVPAGRTVVLLPAGLPLGELPASWAVTSDSIAAWVAGQVGAGRLVLVKRAERLTARGEPLARLTVAELAALRPGAVDDYLPTVLEDAPFETWVVSGREPRPAGRVARPRDDGGHADRRRALATLARWLSRCGSAWWLATSCSPSAASGPTSSPGSSPACSGVRRRSTSRRTLAPGPISRPSAAPVSPRSSPASAWPRRPSPST